MSAFDTDPTKDGVDETKAPDESNQAFLKRVMEEKGEHWNDPEVLAKGYLHAQTRIKELEQLEGKLKEQDYAKQLLERLQSQAPTTEGKTEEEKDGGSVEAKTQPKTEDLESLIEQTLTKREKENSMKQNVAEADRLLTERFGTDARTTLQTKAKELGMSVERLKDIAGESPTAFMTLLGEAPAKQKNDTFHSAVRTESFANRASQDRNSEYYKKMRRENSNLYYSPQTQLQILEDRKRLGDKFYN